MLLRFSPHVNETPRYQLLRHYTRTLGARQRIHSVMRCVTLLDEQLRGATGSGCRNLSTVANGGPFYY